MHSPPFRDRLFWNNSTSKEKPCYFTPLFINCMCAIACVCVVVFSAIALSFHACFCIQLSASSETDNTKNGKSWNLLRIGFECWNQRACIKQSVNQLFKITLVLNKLSKLWELLFVSLFEEEQNSEIRINLSVFYPAKVIWESPDQREWDLNKLHACDVSKTKDASLPVCRSMSQADL